MAACFKFVAICFGIYLRLSLKTCDHVSETRGGFFQTRGRVSFTASLQRENAARGRFCHNSGLTFLQKQNMRLFWVTFLGLLISKRNSDLHVCFLYIDFALNSSIHENIVYVKPQWIYQYKEYLIIIKIDKNRFKNN